MRSLHFWARRLGLFSGTALWLVIGTAQSLAYGADAGGRVPAKPAFTADRTVILVAQFHEPMPPPVIPHVTAPSTPVPSVAPPKVFAPIPLPPDSQAIKSSAPATNTSTPAAAAQPAPRVEDKAAVAARETARGLQQALTDLGYDPGPADGLIGNKTMDALFTWIADIADPDLQEQARDAAHESDYERLQQIAATLMDPDAEPDVAAVAPASAEPAEPDSPKKVAVRSLQQKLSDLGYDTGPADGFAGDHTVGAVNSWIQGLQSDELREQAGLMLESGDYEMLEEMVALEAQLHEEVAYEPDVMPEIETYPWEMENAPLDEAAQNAAQFLSRALDVALPADKSQYAGGPQIVHFNQYSLDRSRDWKRYAGTIEGYGDATLAEFRSEITYRETVLERSEARMRELEWKIAGYKQLAISRIPSSTKYWQTRLGEVQRAVAEWEARYANASESRKDGFSKALEGLYKSLHQTESALANVVENTSNQYKYWADYQSAQSELDRLKKDTKLLKQQIAVLNAYAGKVESAKAVLTAAIAYDEAVKNKDIAAVIAAQETVVTLIEESQQSADTAAKAQQDIDTFMGNVEQAKAELDSLEARTDLSPEVKAEISKGIEARKAANEVFLADAELKLATEGDFFDGYDGKDFTNFNPYELNQTDVELYKIAEKAKASDQFYDELRRARETIDQTAEGLDAITLNQRVTELSERVVDNADSYKQLSEMLHTYTDDIRTTRQTGELEYMQAMAQEAVIKADRDLAYAQSVVSTAKKAEVVLLLGGAGYLALSEGGAAALTFMAQSQAVLAVSDGTTSAAATYDQKGDMSAALKEGLLQGGKYYLPINTGLAIRDGKSSKSDIALAVLSDAATLFSGYNAIKSQFGKAAAIEAEVTKLTLLPQEQAISRAAQAAAADADELAYAYKTSIDELDALRVSGSADEIAAVENRIESLVRAIDSSDEAKLAMKAKNPDLQAQFVKNQSELIKEPAQALFEQKMRELGWSENGVRTQSIRNSSSAGTVGLDDDIRLLEPTLLDEVQGVRIYSGAGDPAFAAAKQEFNAALTKNGQKATLMQWEADAQAAMNEAYREVAGYSGEAANINMTTSQNLEAFKDIELLTGETNATSAGWAQQSASVTQTKMREGIQAANDIGLGEVSPMGGLSGDALREATTEIKVATRELLKDLVDKGQKMKPNVVVPAQTKRQIQILQGIVDGTYDVAVANKLLIRESKISLAKTLETLGGQFEVLLKM